MWAEYERTELAKNDQDNARGVAIKSDYTTSTNANPYILQRSKNVGYYFSAAFGRIVKKVTASYNKSHVQFSSLKQV